MNFRQEWRIQRVTENEQFMHGGDGRVRRSKYMDSAM
jgi:hypothetical protein